MITNRTISVVKRALRGGVQWGHFFKVKGQGVKSWMNEENQCFYIIYTINIRKVEHCNRVNVTVNSRMNNKHIVTDEIS